MAQRVTTTSRVDLLVRQGCHLCEDARVVLAVELGDAGWREVDVDASPELLERWSEMVPVVLVDEQVVGYWRIDRTALRTALGGGA